MYRLLLTIAFVAVLVGCGSTQGQYAHVYTSPTNAQYESTTIRVVKNVDSGASALGGFGQALLLSAVWVDIELNGQKILSTNISEGDDEFFPIPFGTHRIDIYGTAQGVMTLGLRQRKLLESYEVSLKKGDDGIIVFSPSTDGVKVRPHIEGMQYRILSSVVGPDI